MHFSWLGETAVKLTIKPFDKDVVVVIDPYKPETGSFPRSLTPNIGLFSHSEKDSITLSGTPFILATPGEIETQGVLVTAVPGEDKDHIMFRIDAEHMSVAHLGLAKKQLSDAQLEVLGGVDVLFVPVGGGNTYDAEQAVKVVNAIEPRVVFPIAYQSDNNEKAEKVEAFLKEIGVATEEAEKKVIIKKKDLPEEETKVIVLAKE